MTQKNLRNSVNFATLQLVRSSGQSHNISQYFHFGVQVQSRATANRWWPILPSFFLLSDRAP